MHPWEAWSQNSKPMKELCEKENLHMKTKLKEGDHIVQ